MLSRATQVTSAGTAEPSVSLNAGDNRDLQTSGYVLSWIAYGIIVGMGSHYFGMRKTQPRWLKASVSVLVTLSTVKVVLELWRLVLVYGVHLAEARIYSLYWRRHLQDPIILIDGALMVGLCLFVQAAQCSIVLAAETDPKGRTLRLVIRVMLFFLAFASLAVGISLNAFLHSFDSYLDLIKSYQQRNPITLVLSTLWAVINLTMNLMTTTILSIKLWDVHRQTAALQLTGASSSTGKLVLAQRILFVALRNGWPLMLIHTTILGSTLNGIRSWTGILTSLAPQAYVIIILAYSATPQGSTPVASVAHSGGSWDPDGVPEPSSFGSSWGSGCSCVCCSHAGPSSGPEVWRRMLEGWRSSVRKIRIGERDLNRAIDKVARGKPDLPDDNPKSASAEKLEDNDREIPGAVVSRTRPADEEESWIEKSDRLLSPQNSTLLPTSPPQALRISFNHHMAGVPISEPRPRTFRRTTSVEEGDGLAQDPAIAQRGRL